MLTDYFISIRLRWEKLVKQPLITGVSRKRLWENVYATGSSFFLKCRAACIWRLFEVRNIVIFSFTKEKIFCQQVKLLLN